MHAKINATRFGLEEMFYIVKEMRSEPTAQIARDRDRDYEAVLNFVHKVHTVGGNFRKPQFQETPSIHDISLPTGAIQWRRSRPR